MLGEGAESGFTLLERLLRRLPCGDILELGDKVARPAVLVTHECGAELDPEHMAVPVHVALLQDLHARPVIDQAPSRLMRRRHILGMGEVRPGSA